MKLELPRNAEHELQKLPRKDMERVTKKLMWFLLQEKPLLFAKTLTNMLPATHRFRIGEHRITLSVKAYTIVVYKIDARGGV